MVRYKSRYLLFNILYPDATSTSISSPNVPSHLDFCSPTDPTVTPQYIASVVRDGVSAQFGDWGSGLTSSLSVKYFSPLTSTGILRCSRDHYKLVWAALTFITSVLNRPCVVRVVRVSGTIKKAEMECIRRAKEEIMKLQAEDTGDDIRGSSQIGTEGKMGIGGVVGAGEEEIGMVIDTDE